MIREGVVSVANDAIWLLMGWVNMSKWIIWSYWSCFIILWKLFLGHLVKPKKLLKLISSHSLIWLFFLLLLFLMPIALVTKILATVVLTFLKQFFSVLDIILILFFLSFLLFRRWRLGEFNVVLDDLVGEDDSLIWSAYPWSLRLDFNRMHAEFFKDFLLEPWSDVRFWDMRKAEEQSCSDWSLERQDAFWEYGAQSILHWERYELGLLNVISCCLIAKRIFCFFLDQTDKLSKLLFHFSFWEDIKQAVECLVSLEMIAKHNIRDSHVVNSFEVVKGSIVET